ncbi:MAG: hypothetical protein HY594_01810 [Candidatus Omnitrophica bacterium]|nr:hypothetical protein [Candidatus Omnitrophota bacterium]
MKRFQWMQLVLISFVGSVTVLAFLSYWLPSRLQINNAGTVEWFLPVFALFAAADLALAFILFQLKWTPLCEQSLKMVWAGKLTSPQQGKMIVQQLFSWAVVIMALCQCLAVYALILSFVEPSRMDWIYGLIGVSYLGLAAFYWYGFIPASGVFRHVERILHVS